MSGVRDDLAWPGPDAHIRRTVSFGPREVIGFFRLVGRFFTMPPHLRAVLEEAQRREDDAIAKERARPKGLVDELAFDGPGSHVSYFAHVEDVAKERGLEAELRSWFDRDD